MLDFFDKYPSSAIFGILGGILALSIINGGFSGLVLTALLVGAGIYLGYLKETNPDALKKLFSPQNKTENNTEIKKKKRTRKQ